MIKLTRSPEPDVLVREGAGWTALGCAAQKAGRAIPPKYRDDGIKKVLQADTHGKCAYCESKVTHVYYGDVEHILPKSLFPQLAFAWENLTFACAKCNNAKGDYYDSDLPVIDPFTTDPSVHFIWRGELLEDLSDIGLVTVDKLDLNRVPLIERRRERLAAIRDAASRFVKATGSAREIRRRALEAECAADREYAGAVSSYLSELLDIVKD